MSTRTFEEIQADVTSAMDLRDAKQLLILADELHEHGTPEALASEARARGSALQLTGSYADALEQHERALAVYKELGDRDGLARVTGNIGNVYTLTGDYPRALEQYERALALQEELGNRAGVANVTVNIVGVHYSTGDYPRALEYYERALALQEELGNRAGVAIVTGNIGLVYVRTGDYPRALERFERALAVYEELGNRDGLARVTGDLCGLMLKQENYARALELLEHQADMQMDEPDVRVGYLTHRADVAEHNQDLVAAKLFLRSALQTAEEAGLRDQTATAHLALRDLSLKQNDLQAYVKHNAEYLRITEEIRGKEATQKMSVMESERKMDAERRERERERALLYGALPEHIATRMLRGETIEDHFENAAVLFADIVGFTTHSSTMHPSETIRLLEEIFNSFDAVCAEHGVTKVKTIGDSYLCFAGSLPSVRDDARHPERGEADERPHVTVEERIAAVALAMQLADFYWPTATATATANRNRIQFRIGIHSGPVTAGVIGTQRLQYDVWGDTVNTASRLESTGEAGRIQVSEFFARALCRVPSASNESNPAPSEARGTRHQAPSEAPGTRHPALQERGAIEIKGKGTMTAYWLESPLQ